MPRCGNYLRVLYRITFAAVNRLTAIFRTGRFLIDRIIAFPRMTGCTNILCLCVSTSLTGSLLASLICTCWRSYSLPVAKFVAQSCYRFCVTVAAATACESLYPSFVAGEAPGLNTFPPSQSNVQGLESTPYEYCRSFYRCKS